MQESNQDNKENLEGQQPVQQEAEVKPLFSGVDSFGNERLFKTAEEAQQSWQSSQDFIKNSVHEKKQLEARIQELEALAQQSTKLDEALKLIKSKEESLVNDEQSPEHQQSNPSLDIEQLTAKITESIMGKLTAEQQATVYKANQQESIRMAQSVYGDDYEKKLREIASDLDLSDEDIIREAQSNPKRFQKLFGLDRATTTNPTPQGGIRTPQGTPAPEIKLGGFTDKQRVDSALDAYRSLMKSKGIKATF